MVEIRIHDSMERSMEQLWERFYEAADAHNIEHDDAVRQALHAWLKSLGAEVPSAVLDVTETELRMVRAVLDVLRSRPER